MRQNHKNSSYFEYASDALKNDEDFILPLLQNNHRVINYISNDLQYNMTFLIKAFEKNSDTFQYMAKYNLIKSKEYNTEFNKNLYQNLIEKFGKKHLESVRKDIFNKNKLVVFCPEIKTILREEEIDACEAKYQKNCISNFEQKISIFSNMSFSFE
jgi:hypothetical protein